MRNVIEQQKTAQTHWTDESGNSIPLKRVTKYERKAEKETHSLAKAALDINARMVAYKEDLIGRCQTLFEEFLKENGKEVEDVKGNATFYNFDRSIKIEVKVKGLIEFDENTIKLAQDKLDELLTDGLNGADDFIKPVVMDAFKTSRGKLDTKRVLGLRRYADKVPDIRYKEAMALIDKAIKTRDTKVYYQISILNGINVYEVVNLNFSNI